MSKRILLDMDDTIADFGGSQAFAHIENLDDSLVAPMYEPGFFARLSPVEGALSGVRHLIRMGYDVQILTQPIAESAHSYLEKVQWVGTWFPELIQKVNMVQDKSLVRGDYLLDDNSKKWKDKFQDTGGIFVHFRYYRNQSEHNRLEWKRVIEFFKVEARQGK